jgi:surface polysaccharide O-acyltransferase-like enzyme
MVTEATNGVEKSNSISQRSLTADALKAVSIFAVVFIHGAFLLPTSTSYLQWLSPPLRFCVPVFIFFWAYFSEISIVKHGNPYGYLATRFKRLMIPFIFWSILYFIIIADFSKLTFTTAVTMHWSGYGWSGQYYFIILFQLIILFPIIRRISCYISNFTVAFLIISVLFFITIAYSPLFNVSLIGKLGDRIFIYWLPYTVLGIIYAGKKEVPSLSVPLAIGLISPIFIVIECHYSRTQILLGSPYLIPTVFISSVLLLDSVMNKKNELKYINPVVNKAITTLSQNTLGIFCINPLVVITLAPVFKASPYHWIFWGAPIIIPVISTLLVIFVCLGIIHIIKRINLGVLVAN